MLMSGFGSVMGMQMGKAMEKHASAHPPVPTPALVEPTPLRSKVEVVMDEAKRSWTKGLFFDVAQLCTRRLDSLKMGSAGFSNERVVLAAGITLDTGASALKGPSLYDPASIMEGLDRYIELGLEWGQEVSVIQDVWAWRRKMLAIPSVDCVNRAQFIKRFMLHFCGLEHRGKWSLLLDNGSAGLQVAYLKKERVLWPGAPASVMSSDWCPTCGVSAAALRRDSSSAAARNTGTRNGGAGGGNNAGKGGGGSNNGTKRGGNNTPSPRNNKKGKGFVKSKNVCNPYKDASLGPCTYGTSCKFQHACQKCGGGHILRDCPN